MSADDQHWAKTDEQIARLYRARRYGGLCGWCGRTLAADAAVYVEDLLVGEQRPLSPTGARFRARQWGPLGVECASPELVAAAADRRLKRCVGCSRVVVYRHVHPRRVRTTCSHHCLMADLVRRRREHRAPSD